jgi:hypothetical protein
MEVPSLTEGRSKIKPQTRRDAVALYLLREATRRDKVSRKANTTKIHFTCFREAKLNPNAHSIDKATDDCDLEIKFATREPISSLSSLSRSLMDSKTSIDKLTKWEQASNNHTEGHTIIQTHALKCPNEHQHPHEMAIEHCKYQTDRSDTDSLDVYLT